ncbi:MAG TPA: thioredoxin domain-containing protein [Micromonosporaceae bacterium]
MSKRAGQKQAARVVREQLARERRRRRTIWTSVIAAAVLVIGGVIGWGIYATQRSGEFVPPPGATEDGTGIVTGSGPVTVDIYEDFLCPACRAFEEQSGATLDQLAAEGKAQVVYHPIAILDRFSTTRYSTRSSAASGCAAEGGKFREYARLLFENQPPEGGAGLSDDRLIELAAGIGLGDDFASCVRDGRYKGWTEHVTDAAAERGVRGTPTILVNGQELRDRSPEGIRSAVEGAGG